MKTVVVRYRTTEDGAERNQQLVEKVFQELEETRPEGLRYATFRLEDGVSFVHVAAVDTADGSNPLRESAAFAEFQRELLDRCVEPPAPSPATVVGSYGFLG
jgi:hypothetical protein